MREVFAVDLRTPLTHNGVAVALEQVPEPARLPRLLLAADQLSEISEPDHVLRGAIELARTQLGLERVGIYMLQRHVRRLVLRGSWGTDLRGETSVEHASVHELEPHDYRALAHLHASGGTTVYRPRAPLAVVERGRGRVIGQGWVALTPLLIGREVLGVMYNDAALSRAPMDEGKQALAALYCSLLGVIYTTRDQPRQSDPVPVCADVGGLVQSALERLRKDPSLEGRQLARQLGVTPSHFARRFRQEMGVSFVEYRARLRLDRFHELYAKKDRAAGLIELARAAGFGSYSQFHRVYTRLLGESPRARGLTT